MLTDLMSKTWSGLTTWEYKKHKGLTKENLRDNMTNMELLLNALAEETATEIIKERNPQGLTENARIAKEGADVAKAAREDVEKRLVIAHVPSRRKNSRFFCKEHCYLYLFLILSNSCRFFWQFLCEDLIFNLLFLICLK